MSQEIVRAPKGTCEYIVRREDGQRAECGDAPMWRGRAGARLVYCDAHGKIVGQSLEVISLDGESRVLKPFRFYRL